MAVVAPVGKEDDVFEKNAGVKELEMEESLMAEGKGVSKISALDLNLSSV
jgi:hypothetical protein